MSLSGTAPLYTIGHSNHPIERFIELLRRHGVGFVADVRSVPASRHHPQFNRRALAKSLEAAGIEYLFLGAELGARRKEPEAYRDGAVAYELIARLPVFQAGLAQLRKLLASERSIALLCAEKEPAHCHRALLVSRELHGELPARILHILADGSVESHETLEQRLAPGKSADPDQGELFSPDYS